MDDDDSVLDQVVQQVRAALHARRIDVQQRVHRIEEALAVYRRAVEEDIAARYVSEHALKQVKRSGPTPEQAAHALEHAIRALPELNEVSVPPAHSVPEPLSERPASKAPSAPQELRTAPVGFPFVNRALAAAKLVIIGALSGREKSGSLPVGIAEHAEWIDTEREGTHAVGNLPQRVRQGRVAAVIILDRVVQHRYTEPVVAAAREVGVPIAFAGQGGKASLLRAVEQIETMLMERR